MDALAKEKRKKRELFGMELAVFINFLQFQFP
jgi:hypothetical protein